MTKTFAEKKFFYWVEDEVSISLRSSSGTYGGAVKYWCCAVDLYNQTITGQTTMALAAARPDPHHLPCVIVKTHERDNTKESLQPDQPECDIQGRQH